MKKEKCTSEFPGLPPAGLWMTTESQYRLKAGGNSKGAVPVHGKPSATAILPLFTAEQMRLYAEMAVAAAGLTQ